MYPFEDRTAGTADFIVFFVGFAQQWVVLCVHLRIAGSAECIIFFRVWAESSHLYASIRGLSGVQNWLCFRCFEQHWVILCLNQQIVLLFTGVEQHWVILCVHSRTAGSVEFVVFIGFEQHRVMWYVHPRTAGSAECVFFLQVLSNIKSSYAPIWGLLGVQNVLFFAGFEQHLVISCFHPRIVGSADGTYFFTCFELHLVICWFHPGITRSAEFIDIYTFWATLSHLPYPSEDCWGRAHLQKNYIQLTPIDACPGRCGEPCA